MAIAVSYPGVYVSELPSGVRTIVGVSTSIGMFIGRARLGELNKPVRCLSFADFERAFSTDYAKSDLIRSVRLFFDNGGSDCYVMRISDGTAAAAAVTLKDESGTDALTVTAKSAGLFGNDIRAAISYNTASPEGTFNLETFRWVTASNGVLQKSQIEFYAGLSMDKAHPRYCEDVINPASKLIRVDDLRKAVALAGNGISLSGFAIPSRTNGILQTELAALLTASQNKLRIGVGGRSPALVDLSPVIAGFPFANLAALETSLTNTINTQLPPGASVAVTLEDGPAGPTGEDNQDTLLIQIAGVNADVVVEPASIQDIAGPLMFGTAQGGIEVPRSGSRRPAPTGVVTRINLSAFPNAFVNFGGRRQDAINAIRVAGVAIPLAGALGMQTTPAPPVKEPRMYQDASGTNQANGRNGIREKLGRIASAINNQRAADANFQWTAEIWGSRLALIAVGDVADLSTASLEAGTLAATFSAVANVFGTAAQPLVQNVRYYPLAAAAAGSFHTVGVSGNDGGVPLQQHYDAAFKDIDREVDLFNLLVLPRDEDHTNAQARGLWGPASNFCQHRRAFLIMDPPSDWRDHNDATSASVGVNTLRVGLAKQFSAVYFPNLVIREGVKEIAVGPSGAIAGVMARIDSTRGVWKAAAGVEADIRGIIGIERKLSDGENGVLNPRGVNAVRLFPNGIVSWGARTMDGDDAFASEYKYSCVRRLANFMEESLYRGLTWAVFEPNDEPLWSQIRLNVGAFMHNLYRQGAFQGTTPRDAYFVRCDKSTTTQNDINLGIVNIIVGFAPLKPAEFVVLYLQQMAGQIQT